MKTRYIAASCLTLTLGLFGASAAADDTTDVPELSHEATLSDTTADITVTSSEVLAGESLSVLILDDDADAANPATEDIVFIEQYELNDEGATDFRVQLPTGALDDYDIALNTAAGTERYLASLDGEDDSEVPDPDEDATEEPDDGVNPDPDAGATPDPDQSQGPVGSDPEDEDSSPDNTAGQPGSDSGQHDADNSADTATGDQSSDGFLANTGANIAVGALLAIAAIVIGIMLVRRRKAA